MANWVQSSPAIDYQLSPQHIQTWRENGYALVHNLIPNGLLNEVVADALAHYPAPDTEQAQQFDNFGSGQKFVFPSSISRATNQLTLSPSLLGAVASLLGVEIVDLRLTQSDLWPKYGRAPSTVQTPGADMDNRDQRIHCDYPNHTLTHPPPWETPEAVEIIIYFSDYAQTEGATAVVPREGSGDPAYPYPIIDTPGVAGLNYINNKAQAEAYLREHAPAAAEFRHTHLYAREHLANYKFGSVLFYRHDTWHRGTPVKDGALRLVHNLTFKKSSAQAINILHPGWAWSMYRRDQFMEKLIAQLTPEQRAVLGFPKPGDVSWTQATIDAVEARYAAHGIDMAPYRRALAETNPN